MVYKDIFKGNQSEITIMFLNFKRINNKKIIYYENNTIRR